MTGKHIIAVAGATGAQGGSLIRAILNDPEQRFAARALTRDANSEKAKQLAAMGAEVIEANLDDVESIKKAFEGAYGAYCVTFFWNHFSAETESLHAKNLADAAKAAGVEHTIWSSLEDTREFIPLSDDRMPTLAANYKCPHFDAKGVMDKYFIESGLNLTILYTVFYWENFIYFGLGPMKGEDGNYYLNLPMGDKKLPAISSEDIGKAALGIFKGGTEFYGKKIGIAGGHLTGEQMADAFTKALNVNVKYNAVPFDVYRGFGFPGAEDMGNMFQFKHDFEDYYCSSRDIELTRSLNPDLVSFEQWLAANKDKIAL